MSISWAPLLFISWRTMFITFCRHLKPSGRYVYVPLATRRMSPARIISLWLVVSASDGTSLTVGINILLYLMVFPFLKKYLKTELRIYRKIGLIARVKRRSCPVAREP